MRLLIGCLVIIVVLVSVYAWIAAVINYIQ